MSQLKSHENKIFYCPSSFDMFLDASMITISQCYRWWISIDQSSRIKYVFHSFVLNVLAWECFISSKVKSINIKSNERREPSINYTQVDPSYFMFRFFFPRWVKRRRKSKNTWNLARVFKKISLIYFPIFPIGWN